MTISRGEEVGKRNVLAAGRWPIIVGEDIERYAVGTPCRYVDHVTKSRDVYSAPKIVVVKTGAHCIAALDTVGEVTMQSVYNIKVNDSAIDPDALVALLNSRVVDFFVQKTFTAYKLLFPQMNKSTVLSIPMPKAFSAAQGAIASKAREMRNLLATLPTHLDQVAADMRERQLHQIQRDVDALVFQAFALSQSDRALIP